MLFEIVFDRALRQALLFSAFSFLPTVRGIRLRSLHSVNILPPCSFSSPFNSSSYTWMNREGTADRRHQYKDAAIGTFYFFIFLSFVFILNLLCSRCYISLTGFFRNVSRFILSLRFENNEKLDIIAY